MKRLQQKETKAFKKIIIIIKKSAAGRENVLDGTVKCKMEKWEA